MTTSSYGAHAVPPKLGVVTQPPFRAVAQRVNTVLPITNKLPNSTIPKGSQVILLFSHQIREWKEIGRYLGLEEEVIDEVSHDSTKTREKAYQMLTKWIEIDGHNATWSTLGDGLLVAGQVHLYETLKAMFTLSVASSLTY